MVLAMCYSQRPEWASESHADGQAMKTQGRYVLAANYDTIGYNKSHQ